MKPWMLWTAGVVLVLIVIGSIGGSGDDKDKATEPSATQTEKAAAPAKTKCIPLPAGSLKGLEDARTKKGEFTRGFAVKLPKADRAFNVTYVAAVEVDDTQSKETMIFGIESPTENNTVFAADGFARLYTEWGADITKDSPAGNYISTLYPSAAATEAADCL